MIAENLNYCKTIKDKASLTFLDFCSGIGGGRLGLEQNGFKCIGYSEIDKEAKKTYRQFYDTNNELDLGDLTKINPNSLPNFDILISGFPCQTFSIVGKRKGLSDSDKGQIIYYLSEILKIKSPKAFILENVKGLVNHDKGRTLQIILNLLQDAGYKVSYEVLNSLNFGLAQSRERIYFVGIRTDLNRKFNFETHKLSTNYTNDIKNFLEHKEEFKIYKNSVIWNGFIKYTHNKYNDGRIDIESILSRDYLVIDTRQSDLRIYENKIPTLRRDRQGIYYVYQNHLYKLSPKEALKFQGFDRIKDIDSKIKWIKNSDILRQCGNAMSVNVIENIGKNLKEILL